MTKRCRGTVGAGDKQNNHGDDDQVDDDQGGDDHVDDDQVDDDQGDDDHEDDDHVDYDQVDDGQVDDDQVDDDHVDDDQGVAGQCRRQAEAADVSKFLSTTHFLFQALLPLNIVLRQNALQYLDLSFFDLFLHLKIRCVFSLKNMRAEHTFYSLTQEFFKEEMIQCICICI